MTPEIALADGDTISFWTSTAAGSIWPDRLEMRLSTAGASTNVGTLATDVGDFTTLLLSVNPTLVAGGYPETWTQYTATLSGIPGGATGRIAWRYFVTDGGPSGNNSNYIGIDTVEFTSGGGGDACTTLANVPWLSEVPTNGTTAGGASTPVQVTFDSTGLAAGTYNANLCVDSNDPDAGPGNGTDLVIVPVELIVEGEPPNIDVDPLSLSSTQPANTTTQQTLNVENTGGGTLTWEIDEEDTTSFPAIVPGPLVAQPAAEVVGPADLKPQEQLVGVAPLSDWRAPEVVLYDNGGLVTHPGGGAGGADASSLQTAIGLNVFGFGHAVSSGFRVADDFTVPAGPGWMVDQITFFAYQTGSTTVSTINALNLRIWDGPPGQPGSNIVFGDTTTNRLASSTWSNIYRVQDTAMMGSTRPIMANAATVNTYLAPGAYWVDWQTGGTLASGPWAPPVTILGQTGKPGANGVQFDGAAWNPLIDTGTAQTVQDLPFIVEGTAGALECSMLSDIPWLSLSATAGSNAGGTNTDVTVTFDSTGLAVGTYTGNLCVTSNDPDPGPGNGTELVIVPVELVVEQPPQPAISLNKTVGTTPGVCAAGDNITVTAGTEVYYCYQVENTGDVAFNFSVGDDPQRLPLRAGPRRVLAAGDHTGHADGDGDQRGHLDGHDRAGQLHRRRHHRLQLAGHLRQRHGLHPG